MNWARSMRLLQTPLASGRISILIGIIALALPTMVRAAVNGAVTGCEFTPYLPFVLVCALLLRWWHAGLVALASVAILGEVFIGPTVRLFHSECFLTSAGIFLASSAGIIVTVQILRRVIAAIQGPDAHRSGGLIFSLEKGEVWASWYGHGPAMRLGSQEKVSEKMKDFLGETEVAKRLNGNP